MSTLDWIEGALRPIFNPIAKAHCRLKGTFKEAAYGIRDGYQAKRRRLP